ncbi:MOSC domain-containing protein [Nitriliruptoraceae bacterium ZYF776]|nr:MOSC domain-containing protein [Profundirhabdus halotolerans]
MSVTGTSVRDLVATVPHPGRLTWIGLRTAKRGPIEVVASAEAVPGRGLLGDRRAAPGRRASATGRRQVTLLQAEHLPVIGALLGRDPVDPVLLRRNLVVAGINLQALHGRRFRVGEVVLEGANPCHPCSRMEEALGPGGYQAMRGHGGLNARVLEGGTLHVGDEVDLLAPGDGPLGTTAPEVTGDTLR